ncbi:hypothetical protein BDZ94DRAFT_1265120 [Collybia nuda]|uniref:DNA recombination and repair protein Rad51-like C-terminal domain-containing protein n=1 Tax=Collybia nuda TaxID=64659 RepID=A0A9P5Y3T1_9AGAR|nr:hypothetical protein BDZ94DRAFT_1265120 [Collybia nuda]
MLDHIHSDTLAHLLTAVNTNPLSNPSGNNPSWSTLSCGDVVEIQGPPSSGKTHLLYSLLINSIIPREYQSTILGGWAKAAVVFDMDGSFDAIRFNQLLLGRLTHLLSDSHAAQFIARESLQRLHTFRPTSSAQLAATIVHLPKYHATNFPRVAIGLVAIDSISALYWPDRFATEHMRTALFPTELAKSRPEVALSLHHVLIALRLLHSTHGNMIVLNNWGIYPIPGTAPEVYKQHLYSSLNPFMTVPSSTFGPAETVHFPNCLPLTCHVTVSPSPSPRFHNDDSIEKARDRHVSRGLNGEFIGLVRTPKHTAENFVFRVTPNSILVNF